MLSSTRAHTAEQRIGEISEKAERLVNRLESHRFIPTSDLFAGVNTKVLLDKLSENINSSAWQQELITSFLNVFVKHHPEYELTHCTIVSGSSRTALGLVGFHCGIREVVVPDLSWSVRTMFSCNCTPFLLHRSLKLMLMQ